MGGDVVRGARKYNNDLVVSVLPKNFPVFGYYVPEWDVVRVMCYYPIKGFLRSFVLILVESRSCLSNFQH